MKAPLRLRPSRHLPPLQMVQTASGRFTCMLSGAGAPAIVLLSGAGVTLQQGWRSLYPEIESMGRVFGFNRFGLQGSSPPARPPTGRVVVQALRELLAATGVAPPYVLVGHSLGGLYAQLFARLHPHETAGVLLLEATHPDDREILQKHEPRLVQALARVLSLPQRVLAPNVRAELACVGQTVRELAAAGPFPPVPLRVVTGGQTPGSWLLSPGTLGAKRAHQQQLARLSPRGRQLVAQRSGHFPQFTQPELVLRVLHDLVQQSRTVGAPP